MEASTITVGRGWDQFGLLTIGVGPKWSARCFLPGCSWSSSPGLFADHMTAGQRLDQLLEHLVAAHEPQDGWADPSADDRARWPTP